MLVRSYQKHIRKWYVMEIFARHHRCHVWPTPPPDGRIKSECPDSKEKSMHFYEGKITFHFEGYVPTTNQTRKLLLVRSSVSFFGAHRLAAPGSLWLLHYSQVAKWMMESGWKLKMLHFVLNLTCPRRVLVAQHACGRCKSMCGIRRRRHCLLHKYVRLHRLCTYLQFHVSSPRARTRHCSNTEFTQSEFASQTVFVGSMLLLGAAIKSSASDVFSSLSFNGFHGTVSDVHLLLPGISFFCVALMLQLTMTKKNGFRGATCSSTNRMIKCTPQSICLCLCCWAIRRTKFLDMEQWSILSTAYVRYRQTEHLIATEMRALPCII